MKTKIMTETQPIKKRVDGQMTGLADELTNRFLDDPKVPGIRYKDLEAFRDPWSVFKS